MDVLPMCGIFHELQIVHNTGYFSALPSLEEYWQQTCLGLERYLQSEPYVSTTSNIKFKTQEHDLWSKKLHNNNEAIYRVEVNRNGRFN
uniref:Uncharacterized protein n=1 Tax=Oncorhynchus kisutch TaxID=8019 RepID=A0A8C7IIS1_ONCKI